MSTCIMVRKTDRMSSNEFSAPLYSALDEISKLENTFRRTERTPAGFGIDGVAESVQLEQIQTSMNSLIDHLRDHGNTNKEFEEQAKELSAFIPELDHARKRGKRTKQMLLGTSNGENDDDDKSVDEDVPVYDETSLTFSSDEKIKHPGKCMNYQTVRWIEKHHGRRIRSQTVLEEEDLESLRRMFNQLDNDGGGTVDLEEIDAGIRLLNLFNPMAKIPRESIMNKMSTVDEDGSGEIDFQEFVSAMSSGWGGNSHFYRLSDEKESGSETLSFFEFAVAFGREKSLQDVYEVNDATWAAIKFFHELFSIKMVTVHQKEDETNEDIQNPAGKKSNAVERESAYERAKRHHRLQMQVEKRRCNEAARAIAAEKKRSQGFDLVQSGRETLVERAQQKCDGDLMEVLAKHENLQKYMRGADSSIVGSFLGEVDSHHPRSLITEKSSVKHFRYNDALSNVSMQSNASINRGAASLGVPGWINLETIECKVPQSVSKEGDEKSNESCLSSLHSENTKLSPEVKSMVLDFKKNSEKPVKCNIVRQKMARFIAQQCRNKSTNESIFAAIPKNVASDTVKSKSSLGKGGQNCVHDKSSEKLYRIPRPPQGSTARFKRRSCTSARHLSPGSFSPRSPRSHQSRQLGPNAHPRQSILIDSGSVMSELTVVPRQASVRLQRTPVPESGNSQTKGYTYSSDPTHGNWKGASKNAVYPRSRKCLQHKVRTFRNALNHAKETIVQRQRQPLSKVRRQSKEETTGHLPRKPKRNISGKTASELRVFQAFPPRFLTRHPMKESNINNYFSETEDHPIEIFNRIEGRPTEFQPLDRGPASSLDITVGHSLDGSLVHLGEDEYMDTNEQCVVVINPSLSSVSGSSMSPSLSPSRHKSDSAKVQN